MKQQRLTGFNTDATALCKGLAICIMVYYHCFGATDLSTFRQVVPFIFNILGPYGNVCVPFFVLLTGYGFAKKRLRDESAPLLPLLKTRFLKLYQSYWPAFLVGALAAPLLAKDWGGISSVFGEGTRLQQLERLLINALGLSHYVYGDGVYTFNQTWWYMSLALVLVLALPFLCDLWSRLHWWGLLPVLAAALLLPSLRYLAYFPAAMLGVCLAGSSGFEKLHETGKGPLGVLLRCAGLFLVLFVWYRLRQHGIYPVLANTLAAWGSCQFSFDLLSRIPVLNPVLRFLGKHSGNIFYLHSFVLSCRNVTGDLVFSLKYDWLIWLAVLGISLAASIVLELVKEKAGWNRLFAWLGKRL